MYDKPNSLKKSCSPRLGTSGCKSNSHLSFSSALSSLLPQSEQQVLRPAIVLLHCAHDRAQLRWRARRVHVLQSFLAVRIRQLIVFFAITVSVHSSQSVRSVQCRSASKRGNERAVTNHDQLLFVLLFYPVRADEVPLLFGHQALWNDGTTHF